jgi:hypothetical protein
MLIVASAMALIAPASRVAILSAMGGSLIAEQRPVEPVDVIVVAIDAGSAGLLEAVDLIHRGVATRVAMFVGPGLSKANAELRRRGFPYEDPEELRVRQFALLGVRNVVSLPRVSGTEEQGGVLPDWCKQHDFRSMIVVTSWHHSRRVHRMLQRSLKGSDIEVTVRIATYSDFEPDTWWQTREGARVGIVELQKLLWDLVRHPVS